MARPRRSGTHELGDPEREVDRLAGIQTRVADRLVAIIEHAVEDVVGAPEALGDLVTGQLHVDAPRPRPLDLVSPDELAAVEDRIRAINPYARIHRAKNCQVPIAEVLNRNAFDLDRIIELAPDFLEEGHHHHHDEDMQSVSVRHPGAVDPDRFMPWISDLTQREGPNILRCKGIVAFPGEPKRFVFQGVHMILDGDLQGAWKDGETRQSRVVFIGRNLDEDAIRAGFLSTAA